jgi:hypothetical protein
MYSAYPDQAYLLQDALSLWNGVFGSSFVHASDAQTGGLSTANVTFNSTCNNSMVLAHRALMLLKRETVQTVLLVQFYL